MDGLRVRPLVLKPLYGLSYFGCTHKVTITLSACPWPWSRSRALLTDPFEVSEAAALCAQVDAMLECARRTGSIDESLRINPSINIIRHEKTNMSLCFSCWRQRNHSGDIEETFFGNSPRQTSLSSLKEKRLTKVLSCRMTTNYTPRLLSLQNRSIDANADFADFRYPRIVSEVYWRGWNKTTPWNCFTKVSTVDQPGFHLDSIVNLGTVVNQRFHDSHACIFLYNVMFRLLHLYCLLRFAHLAYLVCAHLVLWPSDAFPGLFWCVLFRWSFDFRSAPSFPVS